jgi:hypothetical protein
MTVFFTAACMHGGAICIYRDERERDTHTQGHTLTHTDTNKHGRTDTETQAHRHKDTETRTHTHTHTHVCLHARRRGFHELAHHLPRCEGLKHIDIHVVAITRFPASRTGTRDAHELGLTCPVVAPIKGQGWGAALAEILQVTALAD